MQTSRQIWSIPGEYDYSELPLAMLNESLKVSLNVALLSSSFSGSLRLDKPAGLIIRLLFGFVKLNKNENITETEMLFTSDPFDFCNSSNRFDNIINPVNNG